MESTAGAMCHPALGERPQLAHAGLGVHGDVKRQSYRLNLWALHAYPYEAVLGVQGRRVALAPGTVGVTPPEVEVVYYYPGPVQHRYAHFALRAGAEGRVALPMLIADKVLYERVWTGLGDMAKVFRARRLRAEVLLWELLWAIADAGGRVDEGEAMSPALAAAVSVINEELARPLSLTDLARRVGVSPNHLIRLFQQRFGTPVAQYVRQHRVAQAKHLLKHTNLPVKHIAASVGIPNLQLFNKTLRREAGVSPRALRSHGLAG